MEIEIANIARDVLDGLLRQKAIRAEMRVLVVEDDPQDAYLAQRPLSKTGLKVEIAPTAEIALEKLSATARYVMIFLDLKLPGRDGIHVLKQVRESEPDLPVIIMTGQEIDSDLVRRAVDLGYYGFVKKPMKDETPQEIFAKHHLPLPAKSA